MTISIDQLATPPHVLTQKARELTHFEMASDETQQLVADMIATMRAAPGVGLAAPQIGVSKQVVVIEDAVEKLNIPQIILEERKRKAVPLQVLINPKILELSGKKQYFFEGCLSVKGKVRVTPRYENAAVQYWDQQGVEHQVQATGWYARILQHEIDHLNGRLYVDISDVRTELNIDDQFRQQWFSASQTQILEFARASCPDCDFT